MNIKALIKKYEEYENGLFDIGARAACQLFLKDLKQLDEPETGHADEAPRYLKNILARLRELTDHDREVWLKAIMGEFKEDFSHAKWREGYEQGKFEGEWVGNQLKDADKVRRELNKVKVPQFVADWIEEAKKSCETVVEFFGYKFSNIEMIKYLKNKERINLVARAWLDGYEVEEEERYLVKMPKANFNGNIQILSFKKNSFFWSSNWEGYKVHHTRKELEEAGFGWVFNCEGVEIEEVE